MGASSLPTDSWPGLLKSHGRKGNWRDTVVLWFGPGFFGGVTFGDWLTLLKENHFEVDPRYWLRAWIITLGSLSNSLIRRREEAIFGQRIAATEIAPPLFILGIWRSGRCRWWRGSLAVCCRSLAR